MMFAAPCAFAQNTTGVFGPEVTPGSRAFEVRVAVVPGTDGRSDRFASRIHFQQSVTDDLRLRTVLQGADTPTDDFNFDFIQFEAQYQFLEDDVHGWDSAVRLDFQIADGSANQIGINWTSDIPLNSRWSLRGIVLAAVQIGPRRQDGLFLQTRGSISYKLKSGHQLQLQVFNNYGPTANFMDFDNQSHSLGPGFAGKIGEGWSYEASALFGVTDATPTADLRIFLTKSF